METQGKKNKLASRVIGTVTAVVIVLLVIVAVASYSYFKAGLKPLAPNSNKQIEVKVPVGSTSKQIGSILEEKKGVKSGFIFDYYVKSKKVSNLKAGYYALKPSMTLNQISHRLQKGGASEPLNSGKVLIKEGVTAPTVAKSVEQSTRFSSAAFLKLLNDKTFVNTLKDKYPDLLSSAVNAKGVRYLLEGYLYPATYMVTKKTTLEQLVEEMVAKTDQVLQPYYPQIKKQKKSVQYVLTLASLVEREGKSSADRQKIAGVFENRLEGNMKLQSDISVLYALDKHKENVTYKDLKVDSPYNLYRNEGVGPGPFNDPSLSSIKAVLAPKDKDRGYLYFYADTKTGKVYFSQTYADHQQVIARISAKNNKSN